MGLAVCGKEIEASFALGVAKSSLESSEEEDANEMLPGWWTAEVRESILDSKLSMDLKVCENRSSIFVKCF